MEQKFAIVALSALAQDSRLDVFRLLVNRSPAGMPAGEIAERLRLQPATLSFHLSQLSHAGLVTSRRRGRSIIYSADIATMKEVIAFMLHDCCSGHPELCGVANDPSSANAPCCEPQEQIIAIKG